MIKVNSGLKVILIPSDSVQTSDNCLIISMKPHRRELIQSYIRHLAPTASVSFSSAEIRRDPCRLKIEKVADKGHAELRGSVSKFPHVTIQNQREQGTSISSIQTLDSFELTVNQDVVKGNCRFITPERYEVSLEVRKGPKPQISPWIRKEDEETSLLQTTLQLTKGSRVEVSSVIKELKDKNGRVEISKGAVLKKDSEKQTEKVFLSLD